MASCRGLDASEVVAAGARGREMKFFPAEAAGGTAYLKSLPGRSPRPGSARPGVRARAVYLALPNVGCVGGSWMLPAMPSPRGTGRGWSGWPRGVERREPLSAGGTCR